jgi:hypothetical protein
MKIIFNERDKIETDLIDSIMRSSEGSQIMTDDEILGTPRVIPPEILPNLKKLTQKSPTGAKLNIRLENFETHLSPRDISLPRLNYSTKNEGLFSVRNHRMPGFENPFTSK